MKLDFLKTSYFIANKKSSLLNLLFYYVFVFSFFNFNCKKQDAPEILVMYESPQILEFSPLTGFTGSTVLIKGEHFSATPALNTVFFGDGKANVVYATEDTLIVTVPVDASSGEINVTVHDLSTVSNFPFTVLYPNGINTNVASFPSRIDFQAGNRPFDISIGDLDLDGKADVAVANSSGASISIFKYISQPGTININSLAKSIEIILGVISPNGVRIADLDMDNKMDLAITSYEGYIVVIKNVDGISSFNDITNTKTYLQTGPDPRSLMSGDLNGDGKPDIVVLNFDNGNGSSLTLYKNSTNPGNKSISFENRKELQTSHGPSEVVMVDLNGDEMKDLAVTNNKDNTISVFQNNSEKSGEISFLSPVEFSTGSNPFSMDFGDIDGDGKNDLVITNLNDKSISIFRNSTSSGSKISFYQRLNFFIAGEGPRDLLVADLDGNGKPEILGLAITSNTLTIFRNNSLPGIISLGDPILLKTGFSPTKIAVGDLDGDGKQDIAIANIFNSISIFRNNGY
jgi:FG-GAP-like repeat/IPT/TIG domain